LFPHDLHANRERGFAPPDFWDCGDGLKKSVVAVVIAVLSGLGLAVLAFGGAFAGSTVGHIATTTTNSNGSQTATTSTSGSQVSSTGVASGNTSNSFYMDMNLIPTNPLIPVGGNANFTVILYNTANLTGSYSLSATAPSGLSFKFGAVPVNVTGSGPHNGIVRVSSSSGMLPGKYQVTIQATGSKGVANQTFDFRVMRNLVQLNAISSTPTFLNITVKAGDPVIWVSLDGAVGDDDPNVDNHNIIFSTIKLTSGPLDQYQTWSHTFTQPGVYRYHDNINSPLPITGEVIVVP
jgi:plastocyanin